jgi:hypothetical protein
MRGREAISVHSCTSGPSSEPRLRPDYIDFAVGPRRDVRRTQAETMIQQREGWWRSLA